MESIVIHQNYNGMALVQGEVREIESGRIEIDLLAPLESYSGDRLYRVELLKRKYVIQGWLSKTKDRIVQD